MIIYNYIELLNIWYTCLQNPYQKSYSNLIEVIGSQYPVHEPKIQEIHELHLKIGVHDRIGNTVVVDVQVTDSRRLVCPPRYEYYRSDRRVQNETYYREIQTLIGGTGEFRRVTVQDWR